MEGLIGELEVRAAIHHGKHRLEVSRSFKKFSGDKRIVNNPWKCVALQGEAEGPGLAWPQGETTLGGLTAVPMYPYYWWGGS